MGSRAIGLVLGLAVGWVGLQAPAGLETARAQPSPGITALDFDIPNVHEDAVVVTWLFQVSDLAEVRIFADATLIHHRVGSWGAGETFSWTWDTTGWAARSYSMTVETRRANPSSTWISTPPQTISVCPPVTVIKVSPPTPLGGSIPNDEFFPTQWALHNVATQRSTRHDIDLDLPQAWMIEAGNPSVVVAVCDQGPEWHHVDLYRRLVPGFDFEVHRADPGAFDPFVCTRELTGGECFGSAPTPCDSSFSYEPSCFSIEALASGAYVPVTDKSLVHGTRVAGIIAGERNNGIGIAGIAGGTSPADGVRVMPIRIREYDEHPGVTVNGTVYELGNFPAPGETNVLTPSVGWSLITQAGLDQMASALEYLTHVRLHLGVNVRVASFQVFGNYDGASIELIERFENAVEGAFAAGIFIVCSAGNNGCPPVGDTVNDVARHPKVFSVVALNMLDELTPVSSCGGGNADPSSCGTSPATDPCSGSGFPSPVCLAAPAGNILTPTGFGQAQPGIEPEVAAPEPWMVNEYVSSDCGTSFAAPQVAGVAALLFSYHERPNAVIAESYTTLGPPEVWTILCRSADRIGTTVQFGAGRVNAYRALLELRGQPNLPGDLDRSGVVDALDVDLLRRYIGGSGEPASPACLMDVNGDGHVGDIGDLTVLMSYVSSGFPDLLVHSDCF